MSDKITEIRTRHEVGLRGHLPVVAYAVANADRAFLLAEVDRLRAERRERIATAALIGILSDPDPGFRKGPPRVVNDAIVYADELIAQLDKEDGR